MVVLRNPTEEIFVDGSPKSIIIGKIVHENQAKKNINNHKVSEENEILEIWSLYLLNILKRFRHKKSEYLQFVTFSYVRKLLTKNFKTVFTL